MPTFLHDLLKSAKIKVISDPGEINSAINTLLEIVKYNVIALDAEWNVIKNAHGRIIGTGAIALIQVAYIDQNDQLRGLLIRTKSFKKKEGSEVKELPYQLEALLTSPTLNIVGVNVAVVILQKLDRISMLIQLSLQFKRNATTLSTLDSMPASVMLSLMEVLDWHAC